MMNKSKRFTIIGMYVVLLAFPACHIWSESLDEIQETPIEEVETKSFQTKTEQGEDARCTPLRSAEDIKEAQDTGNISYECKPLQEAAIAPQTDERGTAETEILKDELLKELGEKEETIIEIPVETVEAASQTGTAPVAEVPSPKLPSAPPKKTSPVKLYASLRAVFNISEHLTEFSDGASRIGMLALKKRNDIIYTGNIELGLNVFDSLKGISNGDTNTRNGKEVALSLRLFSANIEKDHLGATIGKDWSIFYRAAEVTDRFIAFGGKGTGVYNAGSDGGGSGTGRADNVIQVYSLRHNLQWGIQAQYGTRIPGLDETVYYKLNYGAGLRYVWPSGYAIYAAYNRNNPEKLSQEMLQLGLDGDGRASILAASFHNDKAYVGLSYVWLQNHVTDNAGRFFDAEGWEIYSRYDVRTNVRVVAGYNYQDPKDKHYSGRFNVRDFIVGVQYTFGKRDYSDMVYIEYLNDNGRLADGRNKEDIIAVGARYKFAW